MLRQLLLRNTDSCSLSSLVQCCGRVTPIVSLLAFDAGMHTMQPYERASRSSEPVQRPSRKWNCPSDHVQISGTPYKDQHRGVQAALQSESLSVQRLFSTGSGNIARGFTTSMLTSHSAPPGDLGDVDKKVKADELLGFESDEDQLRKVEMPLIHPKASVTSEHHPCGAEHLEFPFYAKAFYIGKGYKEMIPKLKRAALEEGWQQEEGSTGAVICLRKSPAPFNEEEFYTGLPCETYILPLDKMDSVVFFNGFGRERELWAQNTGGQLTSRFIEETRVTVIPNLDKHSHLFSDRVVLQQAELNYLRTIAFVLAQTVSLHHYEMQVDKTLRTFKDMNREMQRTGTFKPVATKEELLQMVAHNNLLFTDIISKLGIMERFDIAWKNINCSDIYEHLRADMEIENRNENLQVKLHLVSENVKYLLELMQNQKSDFLEWIIIILIGAEISVSLFDMFHKLS